MTSPCPSQEPLEDMAELPMPGRYSQAIRQHPGCGAEVRLGLGVCYAKLGQAKLAQACFRRALQLKPGCSSALLGLATLTLRGPSSKDE